MNDAAERLLTELQEIPLAGARHGYSIVRQRLPAILAAERRATVERIREAAADIAGPTLLAILDAEASHD
jgi:hypothetical protein